MQDPSDSCHASSPGQLAEIGKKTADPSPSRKLDGDEMIKDQDPCIGEDDDHLSQEQQTADLADFEVEIADPAVLKPRSAQSSVENPELSQPASPGVPASAKKSTIAKNTHNWQNDKLKNEYGN